MREVFPFQLLRNPFVTTTPDQTPVEGTSLAMLGRSYHVEFWPQEFTIHPYGSFLFDPMTSVFQIQQLLANLYAGGRNVVKILANGKTLHGDVTIAVADSIGPLRARTCCLPGGAPGALAAISEQLQSLLVGHGHPSGSVKSQANTLLDKLGQKRCKQILDSKAVWPSLPQTRSFRRRDCPHSC